MKVVKFWLYGELMYGRGFCLMLIEAVYWNYVRPAMLYGSKV